MVDAKLIEKSKEHFAEDCDRAAGKDREDEGVRGMDGLFQLSTIHIGIVGGDGIGPYICGAARTILETLLREEIAAGKVELVTIEGLTIENRAKVLKAIPDDVLEQIRTCHVILKGPTTTPKKGDPWPNIESANVAMRRELDLFANVRPVRVPEQGVDWIFFRENTEGSYVLGSKGIDVNDELAIDFCVATKQGIDRIIQLAFEHARKNDIKKVTAVTKANATRPRTESSWALWSASPRTIRGITWDDWFIDIMTAKLIDPYRRKDFRVMVMPNLYGDILTDEAAQIQGGVGTAGSANIGKQYAMFEAIHGSAPRMVEEGRGQYADPSSIIKGAAMLLNHIGFVQKAARLEMALDVCCQYEKDQDDRPLGRGHRRTVLQVPARDHCRP